MCLQKTKVDTNIAKLKTYSEHKVCIVCIVSVLHILGVKDLHHRYNVFQRANSDTIVGS